MRLRFVCMALFLSVLLSSCGDLLEIGLNAYSDMRDADEDLVFYYPFNGNTNDASGNGNNGIVGGNVTYSFANDRFGELGTTLSNSNDTSYLDSSWGLDFNLTYAFSVNFWVYYPNFVSEPDVRYIFGVSSESYPPDGVRFYLSKNDSTGEMKFVMNSTGLSTDEDSLTFNSLWSDFQDANWHMVTIVHQAGTGADKLSLYVDGVKRTPSSTLSNLSAVYLEGSIYLLAGRQLNNSTAIGSTEYTCIDDFRFYSRAIDSIEIDALYHENGYDL